MGRQGSRDGTELKEDKTSKDHWTLNEEMKAKKKIKKTVKDGSWKTRQGWRPSN